MRVQVEDYNESWPRQFQEIKTELEAVLRDVNYISIEHVGSTSVPGLAAKPILDISIVVTPPNLESTIHSLTKRGGWTYYGEWGIPGRHALRKGDQTPEVNLYVCIDGCQALRNHIAVRDICRQNMTIRDAYGNKKKELAKREWQNVDEYCEAKNDILSWILEEAGMSKDETEEVKRLNLLENHPHVAR